MGSTLKKGEDQHQHNLQISKKSHFQHQKSLRILIYLYQFIYINNIILTESGKHIINIFKNFI